MYVLGIESTAHTFGASVVTDTGRILSDVRDVHASAPGSGIHPREAAEHHSEVAARVVSDSLRKAGVTASKLDGVGVSLGPGLGPCLRVGATVGRSISAYYEIPFLAVNHAIGHIEIGILTTGAKDPLVVLVSGGHTAIAAFAAGRWRIFGETEDITIGNLYDMFAREIGLPSPAGPQIEKMAASSSQFLALPYVVKGMMFHTPACSPLPSPNSDPAQNWKMFVSLCRRFHAQCLPRLWNGAWLTPARERSS
jgi:N6-L-threonylcarbamoyladenine synthase